MAKQVTAALTVESLFSVNNKIVLVTGGSRGIGLMIAAVSAETVLKYSSHSTLSLSPPYKNAITHHLSLISTTLDVHSKWGHRLYLIEIYSSLQCGCRDSVEAGARKVYFHSC